MVYRAYEYFRLLKNFKNVNTSFMLGSVQFMHLIRQL